MPCCKIINTTKVFEKTGNRYTYTVAGMNTTTPVADAQFVFDQKKYPGVEVVVRSWILFPLSRVMGGICRKGKRRRRRRLGMIRLGMLVLVLELVVE